METYEATQWLQDYESTVDDSTARMDQSLALIADLRATVSTLPTEGLPTTGNDNDILTWDSGSSAWITETVGAAMGLAGVDSGLVTWDGSGTFSTQGYAINSYGYFESA